MPDENRLTVFSAVPSLLPHNADAYIQKIVSPHSARLAALNDATKLIWVSSGEHA